MNESHSGHSPYWKRAHHDWRFWVVVFLMFAGIILYVVSDNFSFRPRNCHIQSSMGSHGIR